MSKEPAQKQEMAKNRQTLTLEENKEQHNHIYHQALHQSKMSKKLMVINEFRGLSMSRIKYKHLMISVPYLHAMTSM